MALFSRRTLQRIIDENSSFLSPKQIDAVCGRLNSLHDGYLAVEWEQALLNAASKSGSVSHERPMGKSKPDLIFRASDRPVRFIADITAVSDRGYENENPIDAFQQEFDRHLSKKNLLVAGGFHVKVDTDSSKLYRGSRERVRLKLPKKRSDWDKRIFDGGFFHFLRNVQSHSEQKHEFDRVSTDVGVHISYDPTKRGFSGGNHLVFTIASHISKNPIYNALKEKGDQIKAAGWDGTAGIFLCDGGCETLTVHRPSWSAYNLEEIVRYFLRQVNSVSFVLVFTVKTVSGHLRPAAQLYKNSRIQTPSSDLEFVLDRILKSLPIPETTPFQARHAIKSGRGLEGRMNDAMTIGGKVEMSARELLDILAGKQTVQAVFEKHSSPLPNPFAQRLAEGRLISKVTIQHVPEHDDDRVVIEFGAPDPAISLLRSAPSQSPSWRSKVK